MQYIIQKRAGLVNPYKEGIFFPLILHYVGD